MSDNKPNTLELDSKEAILALYQEASKVMFTFFEWRHKIMLRFFISIAAIFFVIQWMYSVIELKKYIFIVLIFEGVFALFALYMDKVNQKVLVRAYEIGKLVEEKLLTFDGVYTKFYLDFATNTKGKIVSYRFILKVLYLGFAIVFFITSIISFLF